MASLTTLLPPDEARASLGGRLSAVVWALGGLGDLRRDLHLELKTATPAAPRVEQMHVARQAVKAALLELAPDVATLGGVADQFATMTCLFEAGVEEDHDVQVLGHHFLFLRWELEMEAVVAVLEPLRARASVERPAPEELLETLDRAADALETLRDARAACHDGPRGGAEPEPEPSVEQQAERVGDTCERLRAARETALGTLDALAPALRAAGELMPRAVGVLEADNWASQVRCGLESTREVELWELALRVALQEVTVADLRAELQELQA